jgi:hypothetical protein
MDLQDAIKKSIQAYFDGQDVSPDNRKYTKLYLDNFHNNVVNPQDKAKSDKKTKAELAKVSTGGTDA